MWRRARPEAGRGKPRVPRSGEGGRGSRGCWGRGGERPQPGRVRRWLMKRTAAQSERNNSTLYKKAPATRSERNNSTLQTRPPLPEANGTTPPYTKSPRCPKRPPLPQNTKTPRCQSQKKRPPPGRFFIFLPRLRAIFNPSATCGKSTTLRWRLPPRPGSFEG